MSDTVQSSHEYYPVVLDIGSRFIKAGFAGDSMPMATVSTSTDPNNQASMSFKLPQYFNITDSSLTPEQHNLLFSKLIEDPNTEKLSRIYTKYLGKWIPINSALLTNDEELLLINRLNIILSEILVVSPKRLKIMLVDSNCSIYNKFKILNILLNKIQVKSIIFFPEPILSIIGSNELNGLVLNFNWETFTINSVVDLRILDNNHFESFNKFNGISLHFKIIEILINLNKPDINELLERDDLFDIIENFIVNAVFVRSIHDENNDNSDFEIIENVKIPNKLRYEIIESIFFNNIELPKMVYSIIEKSPIDIRLTLLKNIIITGGLSNIHGFKARLLQELKNFITGKEVVGKVSLGSWSGCSLYVSTSLIRQEKSIWKEQEITRDILNNLFNKENNGIKLSGLPDTLNLLYKNGNSF